ncbi:MAG: hypothetical protein K2H70_06250, partial [Bacteroidales bacterium]|nr:hypothetical protein [Bacteroidales bacterium]
DTAARHGLQAVRQCRVFTAPAATRPTRVLLAFVRKDTLVRHGLPRESALSGALFTENIHIYHPANASPADANPSNVHPASPPSCSAPSYSEAFRTLVQPFYLNM